MAFLNFFLIIFTKMLQLMAIFRKSDLTMSDHETWSNWDFFIFMKVGGCKQDLLIQELFPL